MKIEGFFSGIKRANEVARELRRAGFGTAYVDINDHYIFNRNVQTNNAGTTSSPSLASLVLNSGNYEKYEGMSFMAAASPMVSGMGGFEEIADVNCKVVVEVNEETEKTAKGIIENMGGTIENPNLEVPRGLENIELKKFIELNDYNTD